MGDRFRAGEPLSASKMNRNSASTNTTGYYGPGSYIKSGSTFGSVQPDVSGVESFWVSIDEENAEQVDQSFASGRVIYKYSWTEVQFDQGAGSWRKSSSRSGHFSFDPVYNFDPTQRIPITAEGTLGNSSVKYVTTVYPVTRDPHTGVLFFFS
jgi:hypothetical protein